MATKPDLIICDEAVAALDVSVRAQILNLLQDIQEQTGVSYLFISHDLSTLRYISKNVAIMYGGRIVEFGNSDAVLTNPQHPYTRALINSVPTLSGVREHRNRIIGEPPDPANLPAGCSFSPRCNESISQCSVQTPKLLQISPLCKVACHVRFPHTENEASEGARTMSNAKHYLEAEADIDISSVSLSFSARAWSSIKKDKIAFLSVIIVIFLMLVAIFAPWFAPKDPLFQYPEGLSKIEPRRVQAVISFWVLIKMVAMSFRD